MTRYHGFLIYVAPFPRCSYAVLENDPREVITADPGEAVEPLIDDWHSKHGAERA